MIGDGLLSWFLLTFFDNPQKESKSLPERWCSVFCKEPRRKRAIQSIGDVINLAWWLNPTPLKNMSLSVGIMKFPIYGKIKHVPNHQPETVCYIFPDTVMLCSFSTSRLGAQTRLIQILKRSTARSVQVRLDARDWVFWTRCCIFFLFKVEVHSAIETSWHQQTKSQRCANFFFFSNPMWNGKTVRWHFFQKSFEECGKAMQSPQFFMEKIYPFLGGWCMIYGRWLVNGASPFTGPGSWVKKIRRFSEVQDHRSTTSHFSTLFGILFEHTNRHILHNHES
jgi:hypothetical protein